MHSLILIVLLLINSTAHAAYLNEATVLRHEQDANGAARLWMRFTGGVNDPIVDRAFPIPSSLTPAQAFAALKDWINTVANDLNVSRAAGTASQVTPGALIPGVASTPPVPSAKNLWRTKIQLFDQICGRGFGGGLMAACAAMQADIESTYQAGFEQP